MISNLLLALTDWNPQLFREVKGRLKSKTIGLAIAGSLAAQSVILLFLWTALPTTKDEYNRYCPKSIDEDQWQCVLNSAGNVLIHWQRWWFDLFVILSWALPFLLLVAGVYQLIADLAKEERRSTLNFLRLSPQTSQSILIGKLLGVPLIPWLAVIVAVPLHLWSASVAGVATPVVLSIYLVAMMACGCFYTGATLYALLGKAQAWLGAGVVWFSYSIVSLIWQASDYSAGRLYLGPRQWYFLPINQSLIGSVLFAGMIFGLSTLVFWKAINRRFRNPNLTVISKRQSYVMTLGFEVFLLGFVVHTYRNGELFRPLPNLIALTVVNTIWFLALIVALTPQRQALLDWARYRQTADFQHHLPRSLKRDLIGGEKSPALVAIALNLLIAIAILAPWIISWNIPELQATALLGLLFSSLFLLICAALIQSTMLMKSQKRIASLAILLGIPVVILPILLLVLRSELNSNQELLWFFSALALPALESASIEAIALGLLAHFATLALLTTHVTRQLRQAGKSDLKALLEKGQT